MSTNGEGMKCLMPSCSTLVGETNDRGTSYVPRSRRGRLKEPVVACEYGTYCYTKIERRAREYSPSGLDWSRRPCNVDSMRGKSSE